MEDKPFFHPNGAYWLEPYISTILHTYIRFGKWEKIIGEPFLPYFNVKFLKENKDIYLLTLTTLYYAKGIAYAVLAGLKQD